MTEAIGYIVHTDGGIRGNPGPASSAAIIQCPNGDRDVVSKFHHGTNNDAEYVGLHIALERLVELGATGQVLVCMDAQLVVRQMSGEYRVNDKLMAHWEKSLALLTQLEDQGAAVRFTHIPREENSEADAICNEVLAREGYPKKGRSGKAKQQ
jgi:ribonuclease HI